MATIPNWEVVVHDVVPERDARVNPKNDAPIDADGVTMSRFYMTLKHLPTGKILERTDLISTPTEAFFKKYAIDIMDVFEINLAAQARDGAPTPFKGVLDLTPPARPEPTSDDKALQAFNTAKQVNDRIAVLVSAGSLAADDPAVKRASEAVGATKDAAIAVEVARLKAALDTVATVAEAVADALPVDVRR